MYCSTTDLHFFMPFCIWFYLRKLSEQAVIALEGPHVIHGCVSALVIYMLHLRVSMKLNVSQQIFLPVLCELHSV